MRAKRKRLLLKTQRDAAVAHVERILKNAGIEYRSPYETKIVGVRSGREIYPDDKLERWIFANIGGRRAAGYAREFDAFAAEMPDLISDLRHYNFRTGGAKAPAGHLESSIRQFSQEIDRHLSRLVEKGAIKRLLTTIHIKYIGERNVWDLHAHCIVWEDRSFSDQIWTLMPRHFSDFHVEDALKASALANYMVSNVVDYAGVPAWPAEAVVECWRLTRARLVRPAGHFAKFRKQYRSKLSRDGEETILFEKRKPVLPNRKAMQPSDLVADVWTPVALLKKKGSSPDAEARLVFKIKRKKSTTSDFISEKSPRSQSLESSPRDNADLLAEASPSRACARARHNLAYGEYRPNSPSPRRSLARIPWRHRWWMRAWPGFASRLTQPVLRRLAAARKGRDDPWPSARAARSR